MARGSKECPIVIDSPVSSCSSSRSPVKESQLPQVSSPDCICGRGLTSAFLSLTKSVFISCFAVLPGKKLVILKQTPTRVYLPLKGMRQYNLTDWFIIYAFCIGVRRRSLNQVVHLHSLKVMNQCMKFRLKSILLKILFESS